MAPTFQTIPASAAEKIAKYEKLPLKGGLEIEVPQAEHRIRLVNFWEIAPGSKVLEIGCGQGNCTAVLAEIVGPDGHVDAVDPARLDYGSPWTLGEAQEHLSNSEIGSRITWHNEDPTEYVTKNPELQWDYAVFTHCIWYFDAPEVLAKMLAALKGRVGALLIAEYAMKASEKAALPHVFAAITRATYEAHHPNSEANIRSMLSPGSIKDIVTAAGFTLDSETEIVPEEGLLDGSWETGDVKRKSFVPEIEAGIESPRVQALLKAAREATVNAIEQAGGAKIRTMDVWVAKFT